MLSQSVSLLGLREELPNGEDLRDRKELPLFRVVRSGDCYPNKLLMFDMLL